MAFSKSLPASAFDNDFYGGREFGMLLISTYITVFIHALCPLKAIGQLYGRALSCVPKSTNLPYITARHFEEYRENQDH